MAAGGRACPGAAIGGKPEHAYQADAPRPRLQQADAALKMLPPLEKRPRPEAEWSAAVANAWLLKERYVEAAAMENTTRISDKPDHWHRVSQLWLHAENPEKATPPLKHLAARPDPEGAWLATLSNAHRMLDDIPAAMEAPAGLDPTNGDRVEKLIRLYRSSHQRRPPRRSS